MSAFHDRELAGAMAFRARRNPAIAAQVADRIGAMNRAADTDPEVMAARQRATDLRQRSETASAELAATTADLEEVRAQFRAVLADGGDTGDLESERDRLAAAAESARVRSEDLSAAAELAARNAGDLHLAKREESFAAMRSEALTAYQSATAKSRELWASYERAAAALDEQEAELFLRLGNATIESRTKGASSSLLRDIAGGRGEWHVQYVDASYGPARITVAGVDSASAARLELVRRFLNSIETIEPARSPEPPKPTAPATPRQEPVPKTNHVPLQHGVPVYHHDLAQHGIEFENVAE